MTLPKALVSFWHAHRPRSPVLVAVLAVLLSPPGRAASARQRPDLWIAPLPPTVRPDGAQAGASDYMGLFEADAPWQTVARRTAVFKLYPEFLSHASDDELRRVIRNVAARHMALALETPVLTATAACGPGADHTPWMVDIAARLKRLGGRLDLLAMVGPLVDGHVKAGDRSCRRPIPEVAADAAETVASIRAMFPALVVGEIEPVGGGPGFPTPADLEEWFAAFRQASGQDLAFLHADTLWGTAWQDSLRAIAHVVQTSGVAFGVIYKGEPTDLSGAAFSADALQNADAVEAVLGGPPDHVIIQSWEDYPRRAMPDVDPATLTGIARAYLRPRSRLSAEGEDRVRLLDESGVAITGAVVLVEVHDDEPLETFEQQAIAGTVPHTATGVRFILRAHAECVSVEGAVALRLGVLTLRQPGAAETPWDPRSWGRPDPAGADHPSVLVEAAAGQALILNGPVVPVMPDQPFEARFAWSIPSGEGGTGCLGLVFSSAEGREVRRTTVPFRTTWRTAATLRTDGDGHVELPKLPPGRIRLAFEGDLAHRPASLDLPHR